ncbi:MAG: Fe-S cluster assembly ATPase SufC [Candidatus Roizmanbacteria bacterium]|nr:Fe-S cluster assembly ATPase SufC [Candidatus Roizmanbacteria bacterium]
MFMLSIKNLHVSVDEKEILKGLSLSVKPGEIHAIMGPNGSGKSTLAYSLMGHPSYSVTSSKLRVTSLKIDGKDLLKLDTTERAKLGLFLAFQSPIAVPGVSVGKFLRHVYMSRGKSKNKKLNKVTDIQEAIAINKKIDSLSEKLSIKSDLLKRSLNEGFSGGERKKIETLQMLFLQPKYAILDEVDTGLDVDALRVVAKGISELVKKGSGVIIITHYNRLLKHVKPDRVHVMLNGKIVKSGDAGLAKEIEGEGYKKFQLSSRT